MTFGFFETEVETMVDHSNMKLGKAPPRHDRRTLMLAKYTAALPPAPAVVDYTTKLTNLGMMRNDTLGDCTCAAIGHLIQTWTSYVGNQQILTDDEIVSLYEQACGYNPADPNSDQGGVELDVLNYWKRNPVAGHTLSAFAALQPQSETDVMDAVWLFGGCYIGLALPLSAQTQDIWAVSSDPNTNTLGSWGGHAVCLGGNTKIPLLSGSSKTLAQMALEQGIYWVYSSDRLGNILPGKAHSARVTGHKKIIRIVLDNHQFIDCTPDHRLLKRDGTWEDAGSLIPGDSLMPLYRRLSSKETGAEPAMDGYEQIYMPSTKKWEYTHRIVANAGFGGPFPKGIVIHHKDFSKVNNDPSNFEIMTWQDHTKLHKGLSNPKSLLEYARSSEGRAKSRALMRKLWADPEWRARAIERCVKNGKLVGNALAAEGRCGTQAFSLEKRRALGELTGPINIRKAQTPEVYARRGAKFTYRVKTDPEFKKLVVARAVNNLSRAWGLPITPAQRRARSQNAKIATKARVEQRNHKVIAIKSLNKQQVYDLTVDGTHNFAVDAGVFVHNCTIAYDARGLTCITWGALKRMTWEFFTQYTDEAYACLSTDWLALGKSPPGFDLAQLQSDLSAL